MGVAGEYPRQVEPVDRARPRAGGEGGHIALRHTDEGAGHPPGVESVEYETHGVGAFVLVTVNAAQRDQRGARLRSPGDERRQTKRVPGGQPGDIQVVCPLGAGRLRLRIEGGEIDRL